MSPGGVLTVRGERCLDLEGGNESGAHSVVHRSAVFVSRLQARLSVQHLSQASPESGPLACYACAHRFAENAVTVVQLPDNVDTEHIKARVSNGELTIVVPKTEAEVKNKTVTVD